MAETATALAPRSDAKWARALRERRGLLDRFRAFEPKRDPSRALAWFHAPSVGEGLQAFPVVERLRARSVPPQIAVTWFSPSAASFASRFAADFADYLPFDTMRAARSVLDALRPTALIYSKLDVWPVLTSAAGAAGVATALMSATLAADSGRRGALARALLRDAYARLDLVGAIAEDDAERLVELGVRRDVIRVTGDTRYDQVWARARRSDPPAIVAALRTERPTLVAGSTWPSDERVIAAAWSEVRRAFPSARLIIAPHEPTPAHVESIRSWAAGSGRVARIGDSAAGNADCIIVDRVGVLGDLYAVGQVAFVGGGFHAAGLHSVLEPAAHGVPVAFGAQASSNADTLRLERAGAAVRVADAGALARCVTAWLENDAAGARAAGGAARGAIAGALGAADRVAELVQSLLDSGRTPAAAPV